MAIIKCPECGRDVSDKAPACPNCGNPIAAQMVAPKETIVRHIHEKSSSPPPKKKTGCVTILAAIVCFFLLIGFIGSLINDGDSKSSSSSPPAASSSASTAPAKKTIIPKPEAQLKFEQVIAEYAKQFSDAANELQESTTRKNRGQALAGLGMGNQVSEWVGYLDSMATNSDGDAYIIISLNKNLKVGTWNNALSDIEDKSMIKSGTAVYNALSSMKKRQAIKFSGQFVRSKDDHFKEMSLTIQGSMKNPEYVFRFSKIEPIKGVTRGSKLYQLMNE